MTRLILALETSTERASVAVLSGHDVIAEFEAHDSARHDHVLLPRIDTALKEAGVELRDVGLLAIGLGPGSFGGLRVGLATVKGLALATQIPTVGIDSLRALSCAAPSSPLDPSHVLALIDAHRGELYAALYTRNNDTLIETVAPFVGTVSHVIETLRPRCSSAPHMIGNGLRGHEAAFQSAWPTATLAPHAHDLPRARHVGMLADARMTTHGSDDLGSLRPIYIRDSDAKLPARPLQLTQD